MLRFGLFVAGLTAVLAAREDPAVATTRESGGPGLKIETAGGGDVQLVEAEATSSDEVRFQTASLAQNTAAENPMSISANFEDLIEDALIYSEQIKSRDELVAKKGGEKLGHVFVTLTDLSLVEVTGGTLGGSASPVSFYLVISQRGLPDVYALKSLAIQSPNDEDPGIKGYSYKSGEAFQFKIPLAKVPTPMRFQIHVIVNEKKEFWKKAHITIENLNNEVASKSKGSGGEAVAFSLAPSTDDNPQAAACVGPNARFQFKISVSNTPDALPETQPTDCVGNLPGTKNYCKYSGPDGTMCVPRDEANCGKVAAFCKFAGKCVPNGHKMIVMPENSKTYKECRSTGGSTAGGKPFDPAGNRYLGGYICKGQGELPLELIFLKSREQPLSFSGGGVQFLTYAIGGMGTTRGYATLSLYGVGGETPINELHLRSYSEQASGEHDVFDRTYMQLSGKFEDNGEVFSGKIQECEGTFKLTVERIDAFGNILSTVEQMDAEEEPIPADSSSGDEDDQGFRSTHSFGSQARSSKMQVADGNLAPLGRLKITVDSIELKDKEANMVIFVTFPDATGKDDGRIPKFLYQYLSVGNNPEKVYKQYFYGVHKNSDIRLSVQKWEKHGAVWESMEIFPPFVIKATPNVQKSAKGEPGKLLNFRHVWEPYSHETFDYLASPADWAILPDSDKCFLTSNKQSPIRIAPAKAIQPSVEYFGSYRRLDYSYPHDNGNSAKLLNIENGLIIARNPSFGQLKFQGKVYQARKVYLKRPCEHPQSKPGESESCAFEMQIAHDEGALEQGNVDKVKESLFISIRFHDLKGDEPQPLLMPFNLGVENKTIPTVASGGVPTDMFLSHFKRILDGSYHYYEGSLTRPPCRENVHWLIMDQQLETGTLQMWQYDGMFESPTARPVMQHTFATMKQYKEESAKHLETAEPSKDDPLVGAWKDSTYQRFTLMKGFYPSAGRSRGTWIDNPDTFPIIKLEEQLKMDAEEEAAKEAKNGEKPAAPDGDAAAAAASFRQLPGEALTGGEGHADASATAEGVRAQLAKPRVVEPEAEPVVAAPAAESAAAENRGVESATSSDNQDSSEAAAGQPRHHHGLGAGANAGAGTEMSAEAWKHLVELRSEAAAVHAAGGDSKSLMDTSHKIDGRAVGGKPGFRILGAAVEDVEGMDLSLQKGWTVAGVGRVKLVSDVPPDADGKHGKMSLQFKNIDSNGITKPGPGKEFGNKVQGIQSTHVVHVSGWLKFIPPREGDPGVSPEDLDHGGAVPYSVTVGFRHARPLLRTLNEFLAGPLKEKREAAEDTGKDLFLPVEHWVKVEEAYSYSSDPLGNEDFIYISLNGMKRGWAVRMYGLDITLDDKPKPGIPFLNESAPCKGGGYIPSATNAKGLCVLPKCPMGTLTMNLIEWERTERAIGTKLINEQTLKANFEVSYGGSQADPLTMLHANRKEPDDTCQIDVTPSVISEVGKLTRRPSSEIYEVALEAWSDFESSQQENQTLKNASLGLYTLGKSNCRADTTAGFKRPNLPYQVNIPTRQARVRFIVKENAGPGGKKIPTKYGIPLAVGYGESMGWAASKPENTGDILEQNKEYALQHIPLTPQAQAILKKPCDKADSDIYTVLARSEIVPVPVPGIHCLDLYKQIWPDPNCKVSFEDEPSGSQICFHVEDPSNQCVFGTMDEFDWISDGTIRVQDINTSPEFNHTVKFSLTNRPDPAVAKDPKRLRTVWEKDYTVKELLDVAKKGGRLKIDIPLMATVYVDVQWGCPGSGAFEKVKWEMIRNTIGKVS